MSNLIVEVDQESAESWDDLVSQFGDATIYQTWAYGAIRWGEVNLSHFVVRRAGKPLVAGQLRIVRAPLIAVGVAYLFWGPLFRPKRASMEESDLTEGLLALKQEYCERRGLNLEIVPRLAGDDIIEKLSRSFVSSGYRCSGGKLPYRTVLVDLSPPDHVLRKNLDQKWRNQLNRSEKNGLEVEVREDAQAFCEFVKLYDEMVARKQFDSSVDIHEFARMNERLGPGLRMQIFLAKKSGQILAAVVCSQIGSTAIYLLGATNEAARELKAAYALHWKSMIFFKERGATFYDLGGVDPVANPGGYHFKTGFGGTEIESLQSQFSAGNVASRIAQSLRNLLANSQ